MRTKELRKKLNEELDVMLPPSRKETSGRKRLPEFKSIYAFVAVLLVVLVAAVTAIPLFMRGYGNESGVILVEMEPAIVYVTDNKGKVVNIVSANHEADLLLASGLYSDAMGSDAETAVNAAVLAAAQAGFIDPEGKENAVKISATDEYKAEQLRESLTRFIKGKGIYAAVISDKTDIESIYEAVNCKIGNASARSLRDMPTAVYQRYAESADISELTGIYESQYLSPYLDSAVGALKEIVAEKKRILTALKKGYEDIEYYSGETPEIFDSIELDYWNLDRYMRIYDNNDVSDELLALYREARRLSEEYAAIDDNEITSRLKFEGLYALYVDNADFIDTTVSHIEELLLKLGAVTDQGLIQPIIDMLDRIGADSIGKEIADVLAPPTDKISFIDRAANIVKTKFAVAAAKAKEAFDKVRAPLSDSDYASFVDGITEKYGSLQAYWESLKEKNRS